MKSRGKMEKTKSDEARDSVMRFYADRDFFFFFFISGKRIPYEITKIIVSTSDVMGYVNLVTSINERVLKRLVKLPK